MITVFDRKTGKEVETKDRRAILNKVYNPMAIPYQLCVCDIMLQALEFYKNAPLIEHKITPREKMLLSKNPDYINDIPKYEIEGYDNFVVNQDLEPRILTEFYSRFMTGDKKLVKAINKYHPTLRAE